MGLSLCDLELPVIKRVGIQQLGPGWMQPPHTHDEYEVHYVRRGDGELVYGGRTYRVKAGDIYLFRPGEAHGCRWINPADPAQVLYMLVAFPPGADRIFAGIPVNRPGFLYDRRAVELRTTLHSLANELVVLQAEKLGPRRIGSLPTVQAKLLHVLGALLAPRPIPEAEAGTPRERELSEAALRLLETSAGAPPLLAGIARKLGVSPAYLGVALRDATGRTYPEIAAATRLARARELLADPSIPMREVARRVGLSGPRALARMFRRLTGRIPGAFRHS